MAGEIINRLNVGQVVNVKLTDSAVTNGQNLVEAYNYAKTLTPNGAALSATNRVHVIIQPGNYTLAAELAVNTQFVDLIGLGAIKLERGAVPAVIIDGYTLNVTANDVRVQGISVGTQQFKIGSSLPLQRFEDCTGGEYSFGYYGSVSGTFVNCTGGSNSFGGYAVVSGTFTNCAGGNGSFGLYTTSSGTFTNCAGGSSSFGGTASGTFTNCTGGNNSFGATASGNFTNCTGGDISFGPTSASGTFTNCTGGSNSFSSSGSASGTFTNCTGGDSSFSPIGTASGTFTNCAGGNNSFGAFGTASGKFYQCRLTSGSGTFKTVTGAGLMRNCIDGNNNIVNQ